MPGTAEALAEWADAHTPTADELALAERSLVDTLAVTFAARDHEIADLTRGLLPEEARWGAVGHVLDFDDVQVEASSHVSVVIVPAVLAVGGDARAYLTGAGVMARLGRMLDWPHYSAGWHATCTEGAPAAAIGAGVALGLSPRELATAMALAVPAAGGVQAAFGTHSKSLQVGFAVAAGVRAARLAQAGATAEPAAVDEWLRLVGPAQAEPDLTADAVPGGLAIKLHPCCYAMQRPIAAVRDLRRAHPGLKAADVRGIRVTTPEASMQPLIHDDPRTALESKFSMPYAIATSLLDDFPGFDSFTDDAVARPEARRLMGLVEVVTTPGGRDILDGDVRVRLDLADGTGIEATVALPPGSPSVPPSADDMRGKLGACGEGLPGLIDGIGWADAAGFLRNILD